jgi:hypothetical protein
MIFNREASQYICWICGSNGPLTGEHKIKKTDLKRHHVTDPQFKSIKTGKEQPIQGLNSALLKFEDSICARCNNETTQKADRSYEAFRAADNPSFFKHLEELYVNGSAQIPLDLTDNVHLARYFGKHLGCALKYEKFPLPRRLSRFVGCQSETICISASARHAPFQWQDGFGNTGPLNAIGGTILEFDRKYPVLPSAYFAAYMTDDIQFIIRMQLSLLESLEIKFVYQRKMAGQFKELDNDDKKYRGLPYDQ